MSKKLSAILLGVIILMGIILSATVFKEDSTTQSEKIVKKQSSDSTISEIANHDLDEEMDEEIEKEIDEDIQVIDDNTEEAIEKNSDNKFTDAKVITPQENTNQQAISNEFDSQPVVKENEIENESGEPTESKQQDETSDDVIDDSTNNQQIVAQEPRATAKIRSNIQRTEENQSSNSQAQPSAPSEPVVPEVSNTTETQSNGYYLSDVEQLIFQKVNEQRANAGLGALSNNATMQKYARIKSADMGDRSYFAHENPDGDLITTAMQQGGVSYQAWGENIAYIGGVSGAETLATQFMTNWMNSSGHRANILSTDYDSIGIGVYQIGDTVYATQEFMR